MAILRNPIDRAYSAFLYARRFGMEPISDFEQALDDEPHRVRTGWIGLTTYATVGMYAEQLERYRRIFPCQQIRIYLFEDLVRDPIGLAQDAFRYLGVDDSFEPDVSMQEIAGAPYAVSGWPVSSGRSALLRSGEGRHSVDRSSIGRPAERATEGATDAERASSACCGL